MEKLGTSLDSSVRPHSNLRTLVKSYDSGPKVSILLSSVFIRGDLMLLDDSFYTLTNQRLFSFNSFVKY